MAEIASTFTSSAAGGQATALDRFKQLLGEIGDWASSTRHKRTNSNSDQEHYESDGDVVLDKTDSDHNMSKKLNKSEQERGRGKSQKVTPCEGKSNLQLAAQLALLHLTGLATQLEAQPVLRLQQVCHGHTQRSLQLSWRAAGLRADDVGV